MKKNLKITLFIFSCLINFNMLFGAANGDQPESIAGIIQRYEAAQSLQSPSSSSESSSSSSTGLFDDAGPLKRIARSENESDNLEEPPKFQRIIEDPAELAEESNRMYQANYLEELKRALVAKNEADILNALRDFFMYSSDQEQDAHLVGALPEFRTFITENLLAGNYNSIKPLYNLLPADLQKDVIFKRTGKNRDEFIRIMHQQLQKGDFKTTDSFRWLLPHNLRKDFFIKLTGKDSPDIVYLSPYIATKYSNILKNMFSPEFIAAFNFDQEPLLFEDIPDRTLRKLVQLFYKASATEGLNSQATNDFITKLIDSGFFADETPETFKDLFEAANTLDVTPVIQDALIAGVLATIRQRYNSDFDLLNNLHENDKKLIARQSFISRSRITYIPTNQEQPPIEYQNFQKEAAWRNDYTFSVADYAQRPLPLTIGSNLYLTHKNITSLEGFTSIVITH